MKRKLYALSGVFMIALVIASLWVTKAGNFIGAPQNQVKQARQAAGLPMEQMVKGAESIVIGSCAGTQSQWIDGRRLVTLATVSVTETLKGSATQTVTAMIPGGIGSKGRFKLAQTYPDAPTISPGEEVALFLVHQDQVPNAMAVMGPQGKLSISKTSDGEKILTRDRNLAPIQNGAGLLRGFPKGIRLSDFEKLVNATK